MTNSEKWLVMTALERYADDMLRAFGTAESMGNKDIAKNYLENARDARDLMRRLNFGEVKL